MHWSERFESAGLACTRRRDLPTFVRLEVGDGDERCEIGLAIDYRAMPAEPSCYGPTLAVEELATNKILALFDRAEARDFLDLAELTHHFELRSLLDLASRKDTGFDTAGFLEALSSFGRFTSADFGIEEVEYDRLRTVVANRRSDLGGRRRREPPDRGQGLDR